jgi:alkylation response protein AidB-like acyl-CoA dehydrogenase
MNEDTRLAAGGSAVADAPASGGCIARARQLAPTIAAAAERIETSRELPPELVSALHDARLFHMLVPRSLGGLEVSPVEYIQAIEEIAKADASTAWCVAQTSVCSTIAASLKPETGREIYVKDPHGVLAWGPPNKSGRAVAADGGVRVTGTWQFASGSRHATWLAAHCPVVEPDGTPRKDTNGNPVEITLVFPRASATINDVWHVIGLRGTGSDTYAVTDLFVPDNRTIAMFGRNPAGRRERGPLYQFTVFQLFGSSFAAVSLGIARSTLDAFVELATRKTPFGGKTLLRDNAVIQSQIGVAESQLAAARVFLVHAMQGIWDGARAGAMTVEQRVTLRMAASHAAQAGKQVVDTAYHAAGATAIFESNPFERRFRDAHTVSQQVQSHFSVFEAIGQHFLGLPLHPRLI